MLNSNYSVAVAEALRKERNNWRHKMDLMSFLTLVVFAFALVMLVAGLFSAYFGSGKSRAAGTAMALIAVGIFLVVVLKS